MLLSIIILIIFLFLIYLLIDFFIQGANLNNFMDRWVTKTLWIWLPFYALWRLTKEVIFKKK